MALCYYMPNKRVFLVQGDRNQQNWTLPSSHRLLLLACVLDALVPPSPFVLPHIPELCVSLMCVTVAWSHKGIAHEETDSNIFVVSVSP